MPSRVKPSRTGKCEWCGNHTHLIRTVLKLNSDHPLQLLHKYLCQYCREQLLEEFRKIRLRTSSNKLKKEWECLTNTKP